MLNRHIIIEVLEEQNDYTAMTATVIKFIG